MESRSSKHGKVQQSKVVKVFINIGSLALIFGAVIAISNWMAPNVLNWLSGNKLTPAVEAIASPSVSPKTTGTLVAESQAIEPITTAAPTNEPTASPAGLTDGQVRFNLVGDIMLGSTVGDYMKQNGYEHPYKYIRNTLQDADVTIGNLEAPITDRTIAEWKTYVFKVDKQAIPALKGAGVDVVTLANNHTYDFGELGLTDTLDHLKENEILSVGAGRNSEEAYAPAIVEKNGMKIAIFGFSRILPTIKWAAAPGKIGLAQIYDVEPCKEAIRKVRGLVDLVVVYNHWGVERMLTPKSYEPDVAHQLIDAGADLVVGSHPHVLQGFEQYNGKWIAYSLGNFIFTSSGSLYTNETMVLQATCSKLGACQLKMLPASIAQGQPQLMDAAAGAKVIERVSQGSIHAKVLADGVVEANP